MSAPEKPSTLPEYFRQELVLTPMYRPTRFHRSRFVVKVHMVTLREYWKKHRPQAYLKGLCSLAACILSDKDFSFIAPMSGTISAPGKCSTVTDSMKASTLSLCSRKLIFSQLPTTPTVMTWSEWSGGVDVTEQLWSQVIFIWTAVTAVTDAEHLKLTEEDKENLNTLESCIKTWIMYLEEILGVYIKGRSS